MMETTKTANPLDALHTLPHDHVAIAERYASALIDLAAGRNALDAMEQHIPALHMLLESSAFVAMCENPAFSRTEKARALEALAQSFSIHPLVKGLLATLAYNNRLAVLPALALVLEKNLSEVRGKQHVEVVVAESLSAAQTKQIATALKDALQREPIMHVTVDPSILGGVLLRSGSRRIDATIRGRLDRLESALKQAA